jgi:hypothetical protein
MCGGHYYSLCAGHSMCRLLETATLCCTFVHQHCCLVCCAPLSCTLGSSHASCCVVCLSYMVCCVWRCTLCVLSTVLLQWASVLLLLHLLPLLFGPFLPGYHRGVCAERYVLRKPPPLELPPHKTMHPVCAAQCSTPANACFVSCLSCVAVAHVGHPELAMACQRRPDLCVFG